MRRRTRARVLAMQALFQLDAQGDAALADVDGFLADATDDEKVIEFARRLVSGAWQRRDKYDQWIAEVAHGWTVPRLNPMDRCILRLAAHELDLGWDTPPQVVINEAVGLAREYSTPESPAFVNGVLDAIKRKYAQEQSP